MTIRSKRVDPGPSAAPVPPLQRRVLAAEAARPVTATDKPPPTARYPQNSPLTQAHPISPPATSGRAIAKRRTVRDDAKRVRGTPARSIATRLGTRLKTAGRRIAPTAQAPFEAAWRRRGPSCPQRLVDAPAISLLRRGDQDLISIIIIRNRVQIRITPRPRDRWWQNRFVAGQVFVG